MYAHFAHASEGRTAAKQLLELPNGLDVIDVAQGAKRWGEVIVLPRLADRRGRFIEIAGLAHENGVIARPKRDLGRCNLLRVLSVDDDRSAGRIAVTLITAFN